ncbi:MAG: beta-galactosidase [Clostridia bacterium]|nr:beta-galactosidase [Clostridia bacterium]
MRNTLCLNEDWFFTKENQSNFPEERNGEWERIQLPHTWNALDGQDGGADYYRGTGYYFKSIYLHTDFENNKYFLEIGAASYDCTVFINKTKATEHKGGYSAFRTDITKYLSCGNNEITISVSNQPQNDIYPQMADFTFYGGLHRSVKLITVPRSHFALDYYGSQGITATSRITSDGTALLELNAYLTDAEDEDTVRFMLTDGDSNTVAEVIRPAHSPAVTVPIASPHLWQGVTDPYLYTVTAQLIRRNQVLDESTVRHGFRSFYVDPQNGFYLNGILTPLRGVSRHQDKGGKGNALSPDDHTTDCELIRQIGANSVRLAHYQHSEEFYSLCDEYGFTVWAEIPFISKMSNHPQAHENCISQLTELIMQAYNHPSICFWGIANEITIGGNTPELEQNLADLDALVKKLDKTRLSTIAQVSMLPIDSPLNRITDTVAYNHYFGWYGGELSDNEKWFDEFHKLNPDRPIGISEYGCEGIISYHTDSPKAGDYTEEYQATYHEHMLRLLEARPWIWGSYVWNMFDFGCDARDEGGVSGRNNKGLVTIDRKIKKDAFYLYRAFWSRTPTLHICGKRYYARADGRTTVKVYSSFSEVTLKVNGKTHGTVKGDRIFQFDGVELADGINILISEAGGLSDMAVIERVKELSGAFSLKQDDSQLGVTNWFENRELNNSGKLTFNEGYYSVHSTVRSILKSDRAAEVLLNVLSSVSGMRLKSSMLMMMADQTVEEIFSGDLAAARLGKESGALLATVNDELQMIRIESHG